MLFRCHTYSCSGIQSEPIDVGGGEKCTGVSYLTEYTVFGCTTFIAGLSKVKSSQVYFITSSWDNPCPLQKEKKGNETKIQPVQITVFSS